jgi:hypothetical protein
VTPERTDRHQQSQALQCNSGPNGPANARLVYNICAWEGGQKVVVLAVLRNRWQQHCVLPSKRADSEQCLSQE